MALPAVVSTSALWSDWLAARHGPFNLSGALYVLLIDKTANKVRAYRSIDQGNTWAEQDSANAPASSTTANFKSIDCHASGTDIYAGNVLSASSINVLVFHTATNLWGSAIAGPTITVAASSGSVPAVVGGHITGGTSGYIVVAYNGATELVMSTAYSRVKMHVYDVAGATWAGPYDIEASANTPPANTLPGTQVSYVLRGGGTGTAGRFHMLYATGANVLRHRVWTAGQFVAVAADLLATTEIAATNNYAIGPLGTYTTSGGSVGVCFLYVGAGVTKLARCDSATAETVANWVLQQISATASANGAASTVGPPGCVAADSLKLWTWITDASQQVFYSDDAGAGTWSPLVLWKGGGDVFCAASSAVRTLDGIGVAYDDQLGTPALSQTLYDTTLNLADVATETKRAQSFSFTSAKTLKAVRVLVSKVGAPAPMTVQLFTDSAGVPSATAVGSLLTVSALSALFADLGWATAKYTTPVSLTANTTYWLVVSYAGAVNTTNYYWLAASSTDQYAGGNRAVNNGTTWTAEAASAGDFAFTLHTVEDSPERVRFDRLVVFAPKISNAAGSVVETVYDLGDPAGAPSIDIVPDVSEAGAAITGLVEIQIEHGGDNGGWTELGHVTVDGGTIGGPLTFGPVMQFVKVTTTTTGAASSGGVAGV
jgi:hypothetical protein